MNEMMDYIAAHSDAEPDYLMRITRRTHLQVLNPHMLSGHVQGRVLAMLSRMISPRRVLELGTFTGYSALCLAEGLQPDGELITVDHNDELADMVLEHLSWSPLGRLIRPVVADALNFIDTLDDASLDMVFIDADKRQYCAYMDALYNKVRPGGYILADNTLWDGHIIDPAYDRDKQTLGLRAFNDLIATDPRLEKVILPLRDGLTLIRKK